MDSLLFNPLAKLRAKSTTCYEVHPSIEQVLKKESQLHKSVKTRPTFEFN